MSASSLLDLVVNKKQIDRFESSDLIVSTIWAPDVNAYETAVSSRDYSDGDWIVVEEYIKPNVAQAGHEHWVTKLQGRPPKYLISKSTSEDAPHKLNQRFKKCSA